jgi:hypothetical protein
MFADGGTGLKLIRTKRGIFYFSKFMECCSYVSLKHSAYAVASDYVF